MPNVDQFESVFKGASKPVYGHKTVRVERVAVVTDLPPGDEGNDILQRGAKNILKGFSPDATWSCIDGNSFDSVGTLLEAIKASRCDMIVTYRNLKTINWKWHNTLGGFVDVVVQAIPTPVLLLPHPLEYPDLELKPSDEVMALTDHLAGEQKLVNWAAATVQPNGTLFLAHIEDEATFERMLDAISKIPAIDTDIAREELKKQLLREPRDYIDSCQTVIAEHLPSLKIEAVVTTGHRLREYKRIVEEHEVDLVVMHSHEDDQLAMHGLSYPLVVELRKTPMLLL